MDTEQALYFRYCRSLDGRLVPVDTARRNGRLVPRFEPELLEPSPEQEDAPELAELIDEITEHLTPTERRTWLKLLDGRSILDIAAEEGVSRAAVYERIRGSSRGKGGMVAKNEYVAIWWKRRSKREGQLAS